MYAQIGGYAEVWCARLDMGWGRKENDDVDHQEGVNDISQTPCHPHCSRRQNVAKECIHTFWYLTIST